jgi:CDP-glycerol glycerophosphotransferase (TagB/SpsB family)
MLRMAIRTGRLFQRIHGAWRQVHHHGSIDDPKLPVASAVSTCSRASVWFLPQIAICISGTPPLAARRTMQKHYLLYGSERYALAILRPIQRAIIERGDRAAWFFDGPGAADLSHDELLLRKVDEVRRWNAVANISCSNAVPHFFPGVKVQVFHGFDAGKPRHIYIRGFFDLYCTTGPADTAAFTDLARQHGHFLVRETGWPKLDPYLSRYGSSAVPAAIGDPPRILYHSTFSPSWSAAPVLYEKIKELSQRGLQHWTVTLHPKTEPRIREQYRSLQGPQLRFADNDNIHELFADADMMISDTSSALHEFLITGKPVVTFRNRRPGPALIDIAHPDELEPAIALALSRPETLMRSISAYARQIHPYVDGKSSERVLAATDALVADGGRSLKPKPLNLWRKLKIRRRIGYWGWPANFTTSSPRLLVPHRNALLWLVRTTAYGWGIAAERRR